MAIPSRHLVIRKSDNQIVSVTMIKVGEEFGITTMYVVPSEIGNIGDFYIDGQVVSSTEPIEPTVPTKDQLKEKAAALRFSYETQGVSINGVMILTDRSSQQLINGAYNSAIDDPAASFSFKAATGWINLSSSEMIEIARAVRTHVQNAFKKEKALCTLIDTEAVTTFEEVEQFTWES